MLFVASYLAQVCITLNTSLTWLREGLLSG
jgi:hypothetical protein